MLAFFKERFLAPLGMTEPGAFSRSLLEPSGPGFMCCMEGHDAACPPFESDFNESCSFKIGFQFLRRRELAHRAGEIRIRRCVARNHATKTRKNIPEIESVESAEDSSRRFRKFQNRGGAARLQHSKDFA